MNELYGGAVSFDPEKMVITTGATSAIEILAFCLADPGDVFLVPAPYYPGYVSVFIIRKSDCPRLSIPSRCDVIWCFAFVSPAEIGLVLSSFTLFRCPEGIMGVQTDV